MISGGAVEADGEAYGAEAAVDVELGVADEIVAFRVDAAEERKGEGAEAGDANLSAVGNGLRR